MGLEQDKEWMESSLRGSWKSSVFFNVSPSCAQIDIPVPHIRLLSAKSISTACLF